MHGREREARRTVITAPTGAAAINGGSLLSDSSRASRKVPRCFSRRRRGLIKYNASISVGSAARRVGHRRWRRRPFVRLGGSNAQIECRRDQQASSEVTRSDRGLVQVPCIEAERHGRREGDRRVARVHGTAAISCRSMPVETMHGWPRHEQACENVGAGLAVSLPDVIGAACPSTWGQSLGGTASRIMAWMNWLFYHRRR